MGSWIRMDEISGLVLGGSETNVALKGCWAIRDRGFKRIGPAAAGDERCRRGRRRCGNCPASTVRSAGRPCVSNAALDGKKNRRNVLASLLVGPWRLVGPLR
jgi:hypothetical protein